MKFILFIWIFLSIVYTLEWILGVEFKNINLTIAIMRVQIATAWTLLTLMQMQK